MNASFPDKPNTNIKIYPHSEFHVEDDIADIYYENLPKDYKAKIGDTLVRLNNLFNLDYNSPETSRRGNLISIYAKLNNFMDNLNKRIYDEITDLTKNIMVVLCDNLTIKIPEAIFNFHIKPSIKTELDLTNMLVKLSYWGHKDREDMLRGKMKTISTHNLNVVYSIFIGTVSLEVLNNKMKLNTNRINNPKRKAGKIDYLICLLQRQEYGDIYSDVGKIRLIKGGMDVPIRNFHYENAHWVERNYNLLTLLVILLPNKKKYKIPFERKDIPTNIRNKIFKNKYLKGNYRCDAGY